MIQWGARSVIEPVQLFDLAPVNVC